MNDDFIMIIIALTLISVGVGIGYVSGSTTDFPVENIINMTCPEVTCPPLSCPDKACPPQKVCATCPVAKEAPKTNLTSLKNIVAAETYLNLSLKQKPMIEQRYFEKNYTGCRTEFNEVRDNMEISRNLFGSVVPEFKSKTEIILKGIDYYEKYLNKVYIHCGEVADGEDVPVTDLKASKAYWGNFTVFYDSYELAWRLA